MTQLEELRHLREALRLLEETCLPRILLTNFELRAVNIIAQHGKQQRAAQRLAEIGAQPAAQAEGCCRATVYNRAKALRKKSNEMAIS
jgi:hypothetical protein